MMRLGSEDQRVYIRNQTIDDLFAIQRIEATNKGTFVTVQGDYLNYVKTCGVTILSKFELRFVLDGNNRYVHDSRNSLVIKYQYTPNNCQDKARPGVETFKTIL
ncbi:MAG: hypothetical protein JNL11_18475 [Bdellovibrionaceae bacterium]|nr:hypothetical protein [Pseudobdellovibrionaceae bacterium]